MVKGNPEKLVHIHDIQVRIQNVFLYCALLLLLLLFSLYCVDWTSTYISFLSLPLFCNRMIPPSSKNFLVNNLAAGTQYDLCVLAIYDDVITSLTATRVVGCVQFTTESEYMRCHFMQSQFLGGTMIIIIGGIIVASVLVFIIILMIRYKVGLSVSPNPLYPQKRENMSREPFIMRSWCYSHGGNVLVESNFDWQDSQDILICSISQHSTKSHWFYILLYDYHVSLTFYGSPFLPGKKTIYH